MLKADKQIIANFIAGYNRVTGEEFEVHEWPDETERHRPAVDAIARNAAGRTLAIEHTLIELYEGEKTDAQIFKRIFLPLENDPALRFQGYDIGLHLKVGAIPKGPDLDRIRTVVRHWLAGRADDFPFGESNQRIDGLPFEISVLVQKNETALGRVFVGRCGMPETDELVIRRAMKTKIPKLISCNVSHRILLLEAETNERNSAAIAKAIGTLQPMYPELAKVDEVWVADTVSHESSDLRFCQVWPGGVRHRVFVRATLAAKPPIPIGGTRFLQR